VAILRFLYVVILNASLQSILNQCCDRHRADAAGMNSLMFMKNLTIAGGYLLLGITGPGAFSIDRVLNKKW
jgi:uncharacterized membrane protein YphA (DoxX/SURF4 family)